FPARTSPTPSKRSEALAKAIETLESRTLLSAAIASVTWHGHTQDAITNEYVAHVKSTGAFSRIANRYDFTDIKSLGGSGIYQFTSTKSVAEVEAIGKKI